MNTPLNDTAETNIEPSELAKPAAKSDWEARLWRHVSAISVLVFFFSMLIVTFNAGWTRSAEETSPDLLVVPAIFAAVVTTIFAVCAMLREWFYARPVTFADRYGFAVFSVFFAPLAAIVLWLALNAWVIAFVEVAKELEV